MGQVGGSIAGRGLSLVALRVALYLATFLTSVLVSRGLGPAGRGEYYLPFLGATALVTASKLGLDFGAIYLHAERGYALGTLWQIYRRVAWVMGTLSAGLLVLAPWLLPRVFGASPVLLLCLAAITIPLNLEALLAAGLLTIGGQVTVQFRATLASVALQGVALLALTLAGRLSPASVLATGAAGMVVMWYLSIAPCRSFPRGARPDGWLREVLRASLPLHVASLAFWLHVRVDMFMVSTLDGPSALGLYSVAVMLGETIQLATDSVGMALMPNQAAGHITDSARLSVLGARINLVVGVILAAGVAAGAWIGIPLVFGTAFDGAVWPLLVLLPGLVVAGSQRVCATVLIRAGRPAVYAAVQTGALLLNALLNLWWIPRFGLVGASAASTVSYTVSAAIVVGWTLTLAHGRPRDLVPRRADIEMLWTGVMRVGRAAWPAR